jgi:hypothetical protein
MVYKCTTRSIVRRLCDDNIIALTFHEEPLSNMIMQEHMPILEYEDDEVEELYDVTEETLEEDQK